MDICSRKGVVINQAKQQKASHGVSKEGAIKDEGWSDQERGKQQLSSRGKSDRVQNSEGKERLVNARRRDDRTHEESND